jgi:hypothetical protein
MKAKCQAANMDAGGMKIEKLGSDNHHAWKQKIELLLAHRDLYDVVFEPRPASAASNPTAEAEFKQKDAKSKAIVGLTLTDKHLERVRDVNTAAEMWNAIKNVFQRSSLLNKLLARRRFYTAKMDNGEKMLFL